VQGGPPGVPVWAPVRRLGGSHGLPLVAAGGVLLGPGVGPQERDLDVLPG
jgi:hypothetical protein